MTSYNTGELELLKQIDRSDSLKKEIAVETPIKQ